MNVVEVMATLDDIEQTMRHESRRLRGLDDDLDGWFDVWLVDLHKAIKMLGENL